MAVCFNPHARRHCDSDEEPSDVETFLCLFCTVLTVREAQKGAITEEREGRKGPRRTRCEDRHSHTCFHLTLYKMLGSWRGMKRSGTHPFCTKEMFCFFLGGMWYCFVTCKMICWLYKWSLTVTRAGFLLVPEQAALSVNWIFTGKPYFW